MAEATMPFGSAVREGYLMGADNVRLFYRAVGTTADMIVVLHGGPGLHMNYLLPDLLPLAIDNTLLFYDQRGAGQSEVIADAQLLAAQHNVLDLEAVRQHFELERLTVLGHSWGAGLAALYALDHPDHVARMILVDPISPRATPYEQQFEATIMSRLDETTQAQLASFDERWNESDDPVAMQREYWRLLAPAYFADPSAVAGMQGDFCAAPAETVNSGPVFGAVLGSLGDWDWRSRLSTLHVPTLVIQGADDPMPLESAREWVAALPSARLEVIEHAGHFPHVEQSEQFFAVVKQFLHSA